MIIKISPTDWLKYLYSNKLVMTAKRENDED